MSFSYDGRPVKWQGEPISPSPFLNVIQPSVGANALEHILTDYFDLFQEPTALPPQRHCDHRITLLTGADPVAVRPYRYPQAQKDENTISFGRRRRRRPFRRSRLHLPQPRSYNFQIFPSHLWLSAMHRGWAWVLFCTKITTQWPSLAGVSPLGTTS
nr:retrotransposon protein, putative, unclassified [Ipomoea batatas]